MKIELDDTGHAPQTGLRLATRAGRSLPLWLVVLFIGSAALGAWFLIRPALGPGRYYRPGFARGAYAYAETVALLFLPWAMALWAWKRGGRVSLWLLLGGGFVLHFLVLFAPLPQSQDFYQYLFYGKMQAVHDANPYLVHPSVFRDDSWYVWIRWYTQPSVYGPVWILTTFGVAKAVGGSLAASFVVLKLVILALDLAVMAMIVAAARGRRETDWGGREDDREGAAGWGILAYAWNPLVLVAVPLGGANEIAIAAGFLGAYLARRRGRTWLATILLTLAALVKAYAVIGLLLYLVLLLRERGRREALRQGAVAVGLAVLAYAPYWGGWATFAGLFSAATQLSNLSLAGMVQRLLTSLFDGIGLSGAAGTIDALVRVASGALLVGAVVWAARRVRDEATLWYGILFVVAAYLYVTPWYLYWYVVAPLVLVAALPRTRLTDATLVFSASSMIVLRFDPVLLNWSIQTAARYGLPVVAFLRGSGSRDPAGDRTDHSQNDAPAETGRPGGGSLVRIPVPSTSAVPVRTPAAD